MTTKITSRASFTILNKQMTQINTAERLAAKAVFGLFYKVTTNCNQKPYNKSLINLVCSVCHPAFGFHRTDLAPSSLDLYEKPQAILSVQTSHSVNKSLLLLAKVYHDICSSANFTAKILNHVISVPIQRSKTKILICPSFA